MLENVLITQALDATEESKHCKDRKTRYWQVSVPPWFHVYNRKLGIMSKIKKSLFATWVISLRKADFKIRKFFSIPHTFLLKIDILVSKFEHDEVGILS